MAYNLLKGKKGIIFGALNEMSIAWQVAEKCIEEGAEIVLTNTPLSIRMGDIQDFAAKHQIPLIPADATSVEDLTHLFQESMTLFGGKVDFILHSIGMSLNVRKKRPYDDLDYDFLQKTLDISAISFHKVLQTAKKLDAINEWGSVVALSYVAAQRTMFEYNDMADAKAMLESIARSFGYIYGREKRIRFDSLVDFADRMSPLGNATAEECANYCVCLFSDLTRKITMQNLYHDGGFSSMGMSYRAMHQYNKSFDNEDKK